MAIAYIRRRIVHSVLLLLGVSLFSFLLCELVPGDFFDEMRMNPSISQETIASLRAQHGLDQPLPLRYAKWLGSALTGEFGFSLAYRAPAGPLLWERAKNTLLLTGVATALAWLLSLPLGVLGAARQGKWDDRVSSAATSLLFSVPDLVLALALLFVAVRTGWFPTGGMVSVGFAELSLGGKALDVLWHMALPVGALVLSIVPVLVRHVRAAVMESLQAPFLLAARAHGIPRSRLLFRHALRAAANPLISLLGLTIGNLLGASLLIEVVMSWPGLGPLFLEAILARDFYLVIGTVVFSSAMLAVGNLAADCLLLAADPRIRVEAE